MKSDYVIYVFCAIGDMFLGVPSDEDSEAELPTTSDPVFAARYSDFVEARTALREHSKRFPEKSFRLGVIAPLAEGESHDQ